MKDRSVIKVAICAVLASAICLGGCAVDLSSTKEEKEIVMLLDDFEVPMEVLRCYVMSFREYEAEGAEDKAVEAVKSLYAMTALAADYGIDADGEYINAMVDSAVKEAIAECGGEKEYKKANAENNMNDSVFRLLSKNDILREEIYAAMLAEGEISYDEDKMRQIIEGDDFICVKQILVMSENSASAYDGTVITPAKVHSDEEAALLAEEARERAAAGEDFDRLVSEYGESLYMFSNTDGYYLCRGMWDSENEDAAFALEIGGVSPVVRSKAGYSVFKRCEKSSEYIEKNIDKITSNYCGALLALAIENKASSMTAEMLVDVNDIFPVE